MRWLGSWWFRCAERRVGASGVRQRELVIPAHTRVRTEPCLACGAGERTRRARLATPSSFVGASPRQRRPRSSLHVETCSSDMCYILASVDQLPYPYPYHRRAQMV